jgi:hypothetical protein
VAWGFLLQGLLSLLGTLITLARHQTSLDLTLASSLLGLGLLRLNRVARWLALLSVLAQLVLCALVLKAAFDEVGLLGEGRVFSFLWFGAPFDAVKGIMAALMVILLLQGGYLIRPATGRLFRAGRPA